MLRQSAARLKASVDLPSFLLWKTVLGIVYAQGCPLRSQSGGNELFTLYCANRLDNWYWRIEMTLSYLSGFACKAGNILRSLPKGECGSPMLWLWRSISADGAWALVCVGEVCKILSLQSNPYLWFIPTLKSFPWSFFSPRKQRIVISFLLCPNWLQYSFYRAAGITPCGHQLLMSGWEHGLWVLWLQNRADFQNSALEGVNPIQPVCLALVAGHVKRCGVWKIHMCIVFCENSPWDWFVTCSDCCLKMNHVPLFPTPQFMALSGLKMVCAIFNTAVDIGLWVHCSDLTPHSGVWKWHVFKERAFRCRNKCKISSCIPMSE